MLWTSLKNGHGQSPCNTLFVLHWFQGRRCVCVFRSLPINSNERSQPRPDVMRVYTITLYLYQSTRHNSILYQCHHPLHLFRMATVVVHQCHFHSREVHDNITGGFEGSGGRLLSTLLEYNAGHQHHKFSHNIRSPEHLLNRSRSPRSTPGIKMGKARSSLQVTI